ncbi:MAG TPA: ABC transporter substrate-binding protein [Candidatus Binatia bacterium]|nr:ABC transporter substrate-binding protein [Candidatus Binatia bacterium]
MSRALYLILAVALVYWTQAPLLAQTQEQLIAGAKKEAKLVVYASATAPQLQMYFTAFNKRYPFIKTEFFRTGKQKLVSKILFEEQARQHIADVVHTSVIETNILKKRGVLSRYVPLESASYPAQYKDPEGFWTSAYASGTLLGFNSRQVKRAEAPKVYEDLLNPRWKGGLAIDTNKIEWFAMLLKIKGRSFMEKLAAQAPSLRDGNTLVLQLLSAGEYPVATGVYEYSIEDLKNRGAPVDWVGLEPVITYTVAVSLPSQPPRPFAAKLFIEWLLSKEGQEVVNQYGRVPIRDDIESRYGKILKQHKLLMTDVDLGQREVEVNETFRKLFR